MPGYPVRALPIAEAADRLLAPGARERLCVLNSAVPLVIDANDDASMADDRLVATLAGLASLGVPTVAQGVPGAGTAAARIAQRCDVLVDDVAGTDLVIEIVTSHPVASTAFVQLLRRQSEYPADRSSAGRCSAGRDRADRRSEDRRDRGGEGCDIDNALLAESFVYSMLQSGDEFARWLSRRKRKPVPEYPEPAVAVSRADDGLLLELNRPDRRNAFSAAMRDALCEGLDIAIIDESIRCVEIRGRGGDFCAGGDLDEFGTTPDPASAHLIRSTRNAGRSIASIAERVTVHVHGACIGAGIELPAFASKIVARPNAFFELPELAMGLVPGAGGTVSITRRIGRQRTAWLGLTRRRISASTALDWGLIDEICE